MVDTETAAYWQRYYDHRANQCSHGEFMQVLGYNPGPHGSYEALFSSMLGEIRQRLQLSPHHRLLDIACGYGVFTQALAQETALAVGTDLAEMMIRRGRELASRQESMLGMAQARAEYQPFADHSFDRILCFSMLFYLDPPAVRKLVAEILRLLRPGGRAVIGDVLHPHRLHFETSYVRRVPVALHHPLRWGLKIKGLVNSWRGKVGYQAYSPSFFAKILPSHAAMEVCGKADGRHNNAARYDLVIQLTV